MEVVGAEVAGIYRIVLTTDERSYVGSSAEVARRWRWHRNALRRGDHHARHLQNAWNKYGEDAFGFELLEVCEPDALIEREQWWIDRLAPVYNTCPVAGTVRGHKQTLEHRAKIAEAHRGRRSGWRHTPEAKEKIAARRGWTHTPETRAKMSAALTGRVLSPEHRAALSEGARRRWATKRAAQASEAT